MGIFQKHKSLVEFNLLQKQKHLNKWILAILQGGYKLENIDYLLPFPLKKVSKHDHQKLYNLTTRNEIALTSNMVYKTLLNILESLKKKRKHARWFLKPVDVKKVPDYNIIVKRPMDFEQVESKIKKRLYRNPLEFRDDIRLIWDNCGIYNPVGTLVRLCGDTLSKCFERRWRKSKIEEKFLENIVKRHAGKVGLMPKEEQTIQIKQAKTKIFKTNKILKNSLHDPDKKRKMTFEGKRILAQALGKLHKHKLKKVFDTISLDPLVKQLISKRKKLEFEINIDMLSSKTLFKLTKLLKAR